MTREQKISLILDRLISAILDNNRQRQTELALEAKQLLAGLD